MRKMAFDDEARFQFGRMRAVAGFLVVLASLLCPAHLAAQGCPPFNPNLDPHDVKGWACQINNSLPQQAVPQQTIGLGTFEAAAPPYQGMFWNPALVSCVLTGPIGGMDTGCKFPIPAVQINSYNVQYEIAIRDRPPNYDLQIVLTVPTLNGSQDYPGSLDSTGSMVTVAFHPDTVGTQVLKFVHSGKAASYQINTTFAPQLGAFVVPYLPVAVIYQPPGSASYAGFTQGTTFGTTLCWGTSTTLGAGEVKDASAFFGANNPDSVETGIAQIASAVGGIAKGPVGTAANVIGGVLSALDTAFHIQTTSTTSTQTGRTLCKGSDMSLSQGYDTSAAHGDRYVLLKDALFVYVVALKDPTSGVIVPKDGVPTVILTLVSSTPNSPYMDDLQNPANGYPTELVEQFRQLDLQLNPQALRLAISDTQTQPANPKRGSSMPQTNNIMTGRLKALTNLGLDPLCYYDADNQIGWSSHFYTSSDGSLATITTTTTNVSGFVASRFGQAGLTTQSFTLSSNQTNWLNYGTQTALDLKCPELYPPNRSWEVSYYLDTLFGVLLAVPGPKSPSTNPTSIAGTVSTQAGTPAPNSMVALRMGGNTYRVLTDANGRFAFRSPHLQKGGGTLVVGNETFPITYNGTPQTNLSLRLSKGLATATMGQPTNAGAALREASTNPTPAAGAPVSCCEITAVNLPTGVATAKVNASGLVFEFAVTNPTQLKLLRIGQGVFANFKTRQVSLDGRTPCCEIVTPGSGKTPSTPIAGGTLTSPTKPTSSAGAASSSKDRGQEQGKGEQTGPSPCCRITAISLSNRLVSAKEEATGREFQFQVTDAKLLRSLSLGQSVYANFATRLVSLGGRSACCPIVGPPGAARPR